MDLEPEIVARFLETGRRGETHTVDDANKYNTSEFMLAIRPHVQEADLGWIFTRISEFSDVRTGLYIGIMSKLVTTDAARTFLKSHWKVASPYVKTQLLWRMLDDPDLSPEWHRTLFEFILDDWEVFQEASRKYLGPAHELILSRALERYADEAMPVAKKWAYLCSALGATDYPGALKLVLRLGETSGDKFQAEVSSRLRQKLNA
jgi:hypothetical protein